MKVAVEKNLTNIKEYLKNQGYQVSSLDTNTGNLDSFDAIVLTGQDNDIMGIEDTQTDAVIIEAAGMTPQEVYYEIENSI